MKKVFLLLYVFLSLLCDYSFAQNSDKDLFNRAEARYDAGQYMNALDLYDEFLQAYPLSDRVSDVQYRRAVCYVMVGKYDDALSLLRRIETAYRGTRFIRFLPYWTGIVMYKTGDLAKAVEAFDTYIGYGTTGDSDADSYYLRGLSEIGLKAYKEAVASLSALEKKYPKFKAAGSVSVMRCYAYYMTGEDDALVDYVDRIDPAVLSDAEKSSVSFYKAEALYRTGSVSAAESIYDSLFTKDSGKGAESFQRLFSIAQKANDSAKMDALTQRALLVFPADDPRLAIARLRIGIESYKKGNYELARYYLGALWNARSKVGADEAVPTYLSDAYVKSGDYKGAETILSEYVSGKTGAAPKAITRLGYVFILQKKYAEARDLLAPLVSGAAAQNAGVEPYYYLAFAYYKTGETAKGLEITDRMLAQNKTGGMGRDFYRLHILLLERAKQADKAFATLRQYASLYPEDVRGRIDLCEALLARKDYDGVLRETSDVKKSDPGLAKSDPDSYAIITYLEGLSFVGTKSYKNAIDYFNLLGNERSLSTRVQGLYPYVLYYKGWSFYKLADYKTAVPLFVTVADAYPKSGLVARSLYMAGWCLYSSDDFEGAIRYFTRLADYKADQSQRDRALFFKGMSLLNLSRQADAKPLFRSVYSELPASTLADDAFFEYAGILESEGKVEDAASAYMKVATSYPDSPLAEDGYYRRAEAYFTAKLYDKAKNAFYDYRTRYPAGKLVDASLYWGGLAAYGLGEKSLAVLLWDRIIAEFPKSTYRANAVIKTADIYFDSSEYSKALSLYTELLMKYPMEASSVNAEEKAATLKYLVLGLGKKEAELVAAVERNNRDKTSEGRKAIVGLARLYMTEFGNQKLEAAHSMLLPVLGHNEDPDAASEAQYLVAEYYYIKGDYIRAGNEFVKAAVASTNNKDRMAHSIYRAAEMMKLGGSAKDALDLADRLEKSFPQSDWTIEARKLVKGLSR